MSDTLKPPEEWLRHPDYEGITIYDPDGWDRTNFTESWARPIDRAEFERRLTECTLLLAPEATWIAGAYTREQL